MEKRLSHIAAPRRSAQLVGNDELCIGQSHCLVENPIGIEYIKDTNSMNEPITLLDIENKLAELRLRWHNEPINRQIIRRQARALEIAKEKIFKKHPHLQTTMFKG